MIVLAMFTLNIFHPGFLLTDDNLIRSKEQDSVFAMSKKDIKDGTVISESVVVV